MPAIEGISLFENGAEGKVTCVDYQAEREGVVGKGKDRGHGKGMNEGTKSRISFS